MFFWILILYGFINTCIFFQHVRPICLVIRSTLNPDRPMFLFVFFVLFLIYSVFGWVLLLTDKFLLNANSRV